MKKMKWEKIKEKLAKVYNAPNGIDIREKLKIKQKGGSKNVKRVNTPDKG